MSPQQLKYLAANWELIAKSLTKVNNRSLRTFSSIMNESVTELARHPEPLVTLNLLLKLSLETRREELDHQFRIHVLTVELPTLGKDVLRSLTTGRFENTSNFPLLKNSRLPRFLHECFYYHYDNNGYLRESTVSDIATLRQILMMYYKLELPFTEEQELTAHRKFIDIDNSVKTHNWPESFNLVRDTFISTLPLDPYDFVPSHSNGATNTSGINNHDKRCTWRFNTALYSAFPDLYPPLALFDGSVMPVNSKLTVVPKDSRGPRTICMEPHERMYVQKGLMLKLYSHVESSFPTSGYVNFTDQSINQRLAYSSSIDASFATLDLKDASDLVSWPLISQLLNGTEWFEVLDVTRSRVVDTKVGPHILNKFAPMGSALCFPIEALLFWSIAKSVSPVVYVYGDDIIVPSENAMDVISALESYGLSVNVDKSFIKGHFRESCGAYYYNGHDVSIVQCNSLDTSSVIEFVNLLADRFHCENLQDQLITLWSDYVGFFVPRSSSVITPPLCFKSAKTSCNDVFLKRRYNLHLQKFQVRILQPSTRPLPPLSDDYFSYHEWTTARVSASSFEEATCLRMLNSVLNQHYTSFGRQQLSVGINLVEKREKLTFTWIDSSALEA